VIRVVENCVINTIVEEAFLQGWIKELDPIIAGGSILYLYLTFGDEKSNSSRQVLSEIAVRKRLRAKGSAHRYRDKHRSPLFDYSGDVDIWLSEEGTLSLAVARADANLSLIKETNWAKTYTLPDVNKDIFNRASTLQIIKKIHKTPERLLETFDIANCMIAWRGGRLYIDERLEQSFSDGLINYINNPFEKERSIGAKLFNALRLFKYSRKYNLSFSKEINEIILKLYMEVDDLMLDKYEERVVANSHYGITTCSSSVIDKMARYFGSSFPGWYGMKTFPEENLAFFVNLKSDRLSSVKTFVSGALGSDGGGDGYKHFNCIRI
jgi:hypothetical protein